MTVARLFAEMDSREFSYWQAIHRYYDPVGGEWDQAGLIASAAIAPYCDRGRTPQPREFVPVDKPPQHEVQIQEELLKVAQALGQVPNK